LRSDPVPSPDSTGSSGERRITGASTAARRAAEAAAKAAEAERGRTRAMLIGGAVVLAVAMALGALAWSSAGTSEVPVASPPRVAPATPALPTHDPPAALQPPMATDPTPAADPPVAAGSTSPTDRGDPPPATTTERRPRDRRSGAAQEGGRRAPGSREHIVRDLDF
jgi:hypothetical protein